MNEVKVKLSQGTVRGCLEKLPDGRDFKRFSRIPYAQPPVNELRFRDPKKLIKFESEEINCTDEKNFACFHRHIINRTYVGSEDCLYLNVYVPPMENDFKLAVMVYIHGGGFSLDSSTIEWYSPEYLLKENVVVVTLNYRLHVLGFASLPSMGISGNAGLKDQQMALEWVYENISHFGGDPKKICLFGESAGGASVHLQVLNEKSRKFINSAICQSGCALGDWVIQKDAVDVTRKLGKILGAKSDSDLDILEALMSASPEDLFKYKAKPQDPDDRRRNLIFTFKPSIEIESPDSFMNKTPATLIKSQAGKIKIPIIFGTTDQDGIAMVGSQYQYLTDLFNDDLVRLVPQSLAIDPKSEAAKLLAEEIKFFYFGENSINEKTLQNFIDHMTDFHFFIPQVMSVELHQHFHHENNIFLYEFRFDGELNVYKTLFQLNHIPGASHADELAYLFKNRATGTEVEEHSREGKLRTQICKMWTNFAKHNDPTPNFESSFPFEWKSCKRHNDLDYLVIDDEENTKMLKNINEKRVYFWREIYKRYNKGFITCKL